MEFPGNYKINTFSCLMKLKWHKCMCCIQYNVNLTAWFQGKYACECISVCVCVFLCVCVCVCAHVRACVCNSKIQVVESACVKSLMILPCTL